MNDNIRALAAEVDRLDAAVYTIAEDYCVHCDQPIVFKPFWLDGKQPNPPIWFHPRGGVTCSLASAPPGPWPKATPKGGTR